MRLAKPRISPLQDSELTPEQAERLTDYMSTVMAGLSASARNGHDLDRLLAAARLAGAGLEQVVRG